MPAVETIIVGGGIAATNPFTIGALPYIVNNSPASISATSVAGFTTGTGGIHPAIVVAASITDPQPAASEVLRVVGGIISEMVGLPDSVILGRTASAAVATAVGPIALTSGSMAVGVGSSATGNLSVAVGSLASANGGGGAGNASAFGYNAVASATQATALGAMATASGTASLACGRGAIADATGAIAIGGGANSNGFAAITMGFNAPPRAANQILIVSGGSAASTTGATGGLILLSGGTVNIAHADNIAIGVNATSFAANVAQVGASGTPITTCVIGRGNTSTAAIAAGLTVRGTDGSGTNIAVGDLTIIAPRSTGNATSGAINLQVGVTQASGTTSQTARTGVAVRDTNTATETYLMVYDVDNATLERVTVGAADSGGAGFKVLRIPN